MAYYDTATRKFIHKENKTRMTPVKTVKINIPASYDVGSVSGNKDLIYSKIKEFSYNYFKKRVKDFENYYDYDVEDNQIVIEVDNLYHEVLIDKSESGFFCDFIKLFLDSCLPREYLKIYITVNMTGNNTAEIKCKMEGKYTTSFAEHNPRFYNNMEPDFSFLLKSYNRHFAKKLQNYLNNN